MAGKYEKYFARKPVIRDWLPNHGDPKPAPGEKGTQIHHVYIDKEIMPHAKKHVMLNWFGKDSLSEDMKRLFAERAQTEEWNEMEIGVPTHYHPYDELILFLGAVPGKYDTLGGAILEMKMGPEAEPYIIDCTTALYIPARLPHSLVWKQADGNHMLAVIMMGDEYADASQS